MKRWTDRYLLENSIKRHNRLPVSYKIKKTHVKYAIKKLKENKPFDLGSISSSLYKLEQSKRNLEELRLSDLRAKQKYESIVNRRDPDEYKGIGSILNLPRRKL